MPIETQTPRLIDANALLEAMNIARKDRPDSPDDLSDYGFWIMDKLIQSAPTVDVSEIQEKAWSTALFVNNFSIMNQRLIDANALKEDIEMLRNKSCFDISEDLTSHDTVGFWAGFEYLAKFIESAPTVETTDDVMAMLPNTKGNLKMGLELHYDPEIRKWACGYPYTQVWGYGFTPLEAVKKLEASLNKK